MADSDTIQFISAPLVEKRKPRPGSAGVWDALEGLEFPADKESAIRLAGEKTVEFTPNDRLRLAELLRKSPATEFDSMASIAAEIDRLVHSPAKDAETHAA